jgi:hypothetical protein
LSSSQQETKTNKTKQKKEIPVQEGSQVNDVRITDTKNLPKFAKDAVLEVSYAEMRIKALGTLGDIIQAYHAGVVVKVLDFGSTKDVENIPEEFTVEWYAVFFPFGAFLPEIKPLNDDDDDDDKLGLEWENESYAFYNPAVDRSRWQRGIEPVGTISGALFERWGRWIVDDFVPNQPGYQAFEVWDRPSLIPQTTKRFVDSITCSTFTEKSFEFLFSGDNGENNGDATETETEQHNGAGDSQLTAEVVLRRSYVTLIAKTGAKKVNIEDPVEAAAVREFYTILSREARGGNNEKAMSTSDFIRLLADRLETFYVYEPAKEEYYQVDLVRPYFALTDMYQPMALPWQDELLMSGGLDGDDDDGGRSFLSRTAYGEELSDAAKGVANLIQKRLPSILEDKIPFIPENIRPFVPVGLGLVVIVAVATNIEFFSGLSLGIVLGGVGVKALSATTAEE